MSNVGGGRKLSRHAELQTLSDNALLARLRPLPRGSAERDVICEILVTRYAGLLQSCARRYRYSPEPVEDLTQEQIGDRLGVSQMHVSRLLERALSYLRAQITESA
jgi:DNA-directed RNA polymerase specialized sigma subunit